MDYILLDSREQRRLGIILPHKVSTYSCVALSNTNYFLLTYLSTFMANIFIKFSWRQEKYPTNVAHTFISYSIIRKSSKLYSPLVCCFQVSNSAGRWRYPWYESLNHARQNIASNLHVNHPVCASILNHWHEK